MSNPFAQVEILAEIAEIEQKLTDTTLKPEKIRALQEELKTAREAYKNLK